MLIGDRLSEKGGAALLLGLSVIPYLQFILLVRYSRLIVPKVDFYIECTYFWVPALPGPTLVRHRLETTTFSHGMKHGWEQ